MGRQTVAERHATGGGTGPPGAPSALNAVELCGRVTSAPVARALPSGDEVVTFRLSVPRSGGRVSGRAVSDWVDCAAWTARERRAVCGWQVGDRVRVTGALRRRFYGSGADRGTRLEVEVVRARRLVRGG